jgi:hypothetical protein
MGHFSHNCKLSKLPITGGPAVLIPMVMSKNLYDNSEESIRVLGKTYMCSNDGTRLKFIPCMFPIHGEYDTYGRLKNIVEDDNTKIIEEYYGLPIQTITDIICSGRKDDGFDDVLKNVMDSSVKYEYGKPVYQERYKELLKISGMWVHGEFYDKITSDGVKDEYDNIDLGKDIVLTALGFKKLPESSNDKRYSKQYEKDGLIINSDGTWINIPNEFVYTFKQLKSYCNKKGVEIDITPFTERDVWEQRFDFLLKNNNIKVKNSDKNLFKEAINYLQSPDKLGNSEIKQNLVKILGFDENVSNEKLIEFLDGYVDNFNVRLSRDEQFLVYLMLNTDGYSAYNVTNPLTELYLKAAKEGKLKDNFVRFWRFDKLMYACGVFYDIVGTSPQDGEHFEVSRVLKTANQILDKDLSEWDAENEDYDDEE